MGRALSLADFRPLTDDPVGMLVPPLHVLECNVYRGPHLFSHLPMVRIQLQLGELENYPTNLLLDFSRRLLAMLPGLAEHGCSSGERGGFVARIEEGTWLGHVIEHVAIELQRMVGEDVTRGKTRSVKGIKGA